MKSSFLIYALVTLALLSYALYQGMVAAPTERTMGEIQRIFYYHVPSAWTAFLCFIANFVASITYLVRRNPKADAIAVTTAEVGVVFTTVVLITGPLWAKPVWGIWWTWDARLTTTLVLWLIYVSYLMFRRFSTGQQTATLAAALAIFGFIDVPIVYMSIRWWRTQHPKPVIAGGAGSGIDPEMWSALLWNLAAFVAFAGLLIWVRYRLERTRQQIDEMHALRALASTEGTLTR
ncbi:MAG TPA: cytochrome c biogenesis protein CcsA [Terriglobales bacterium]|jgi:heme exporter protein C|nr:cytochrome c biogenesis protein CcsA [Terriglobales bacterium]